VPTPTKKIVPKKDIADTLTDWIGTKASLVVHTIIFASIFGLRLFGVSMDKILLLLTTCLSIEAIYLAIFIQITVNKNTQSLVEVEQDIDEIQEDVDEIQEDVDEIQEDVEEEDLHDKEVHETLESIEQRLHQLQKDFEILRKKDKVT